VDTPDFAVDFNFSDAELETYFDASPENQFNLALLRQFPDARLGGGAAERGIHNIAPAAPRTVVRQRGSSEPVLSGTPVAPPAVNSGWECERYVIRALQEDGWTVHDVSRQKLGYDILAKKGRQTRYIDVKSSLGMCSPTLTAREWQQATMQGAAYVLAIIENFNPLGVAVVYWVPNPAVRCTARESIQVCFSIARTSWTSATVMLRDI
jgi:hypothetical protein